jgi:cytochrome c-type biogenesis protein
MDFLISFLEGIITFISPCLLPMLPLYLFYFAGEEQGSTRKTFRHALGFVLGFTLLFTLMGAFAGSLGSLLHTHQTAVNLISGALIVLFGLNYTGLLRIPLLNRTHQWNAEIQKFGFFSSLLFGMIFALGWTPCAGAFLGSALLLAAQKGSMLHGILMLLCYSMGLGIPFLLSAVLIDQLKRTISFIKKHYSIIQLICGIFLILLGILMMTGVMSRFLYSLS